MRSVNLLLFVVLLISPFQTALADQAETLFKTLDQNQDRQLQIDEIPPQHHRLFTRLLRTADQNQDGKLTSAEFETGLQPQAPTKPLIKKSGSELPGTDALLLLLAKMDSNGDGTIVADEVPRQFRDIFDRTEKRLGGKPDGVLDRRELTQAAPRLSRVAMQIAKRLDLDVELELALLSKPQWQAVQNMIGPRRRGEFLSDPQQAREFFRRLDANGNGQITAAEVPDALAQRFEQLLRRADRNHDEQLNEQEILKYSQQLKNVAANRLTPAQIQAGIKRLLKQRDRNRDGQINRQEAPRRLAARFDRADTDGSGQLENNELAAVVELLSRLRRPESQPTSQADSMMQSEN